MTDLPAAVLRYAAFTDDTLGGNPAGVCLDAAGLSASQMQQIAFEIGYSETAFLVRDFSDPLVFDVRYFAPVAEVPFCGHATVASGVALAAQLGLGSGGAQFVFRTPAGEVPVDVRVDRGSVVATLTSVEPALVGLAGADLAELLAGLGWSGGDLDPGLPPAVAFAGAWHPVLAAATRARLAVLDYDVDRLRTLMLERGWTTVHLVWRESNEVFHVRDPFPVGGVYEDPATGAAAAAFGHYLREHGLARAGAPVILMQGEDLGRPSRLTVAVAEGDSRVRVSGTAVPIC